MKGKLAKKNVRYIKQVTDEKGRITKRSKVIERKWQDMDFAREWKNCAEPETYSGYTLIILAVCILMLLAVIWRMR